MGEEIKGCKIIIKDGIDNKAELYKIHTGKILIVDISDNPSVQSKYLLLNKRIDDYLEKNEFDGIRIIKSNELIVDMSNKINLDRLRSRYYKNIKDFLLNTKVGWAISTVLVYSILYFFYLLGYSFLYGFYFGGELNSTSSIMEILVNPVPFKLQSTVIIGAIYFVLVVAIFLAMTFIIKEKKLKVKIVGMLVFLIIGFFLTQVVSVFFIGLKTESSFVDGLMLYLSIMILPILFLIIVPFSTLLSCSTLIMLSSTFYTINIFVLSIILKIGGGGQTNLYTLAFLTITPLIARLINKIKDYVSRIKNSQVKNIFNIIIQCIIWLPFGTTLLGICIALTKSGIIKFKFLLMIVAVIGIVIIVVIIYKKKKNENKKKDKEMNKINKYNKYDVMLISSYVLVVMVLLLVVTPNFTLEIGKYMRTIILNTKFDKITYGNNNQVKDVVIGKVIAQDNNTYYISNFPRYELVTIKDTNIVVKPLANLQFTSKYNNINKINDKLQELTDEVKAKLSPANPKVEVQFTPLNLIENESEKHYRFTIKIQQHDTKRIQRKTIYENQVDYSYDESNNITYLEIITCLNTNVVNDELKKQLKEFDKELYKYIKEEFNLPKPKLCEEKFYYNNGMLQYTETTREDFLIKKYELKKW